MSFCIKCYIFRIFVFYMEKYSSRQIKIDLITGDYNPIIEWFNDLWSKLLIMETNVFNEKGGEFIYHTLDNDFLFYIDIQNGLYYCDLVNYWQHLESRLDHRYDELLTISKTLLEHVLGISTNNPQIIFKGSSNHVVIMSSLNGN